jgi:hypothetical protein
MLDPNAADLEAPEGSGSVPINTKPPDVSPFYVVGCFLVNIYIYWYYNTFSTVWFVVVVLPVSYWTYSYKARLWLWLETAPRNVELPDLERIIADDAARVKVDPELLAHLYFALMYTKRDDRKMLELRRRGDAWLQRSRPKRTEVVRTSQVAKATVMAMGFSAADDAASSVLGWGSVWKGLLRANGFAMGALESGRNLPRA